MGSTKKVIPMQGARTILAFFDTSAAKRPFQNGILAAEGLKNTKFDPHAAWVQEKICSPCSVGSEILTFATPFD